MNLHSKPECLSLAGLSSLVKCVCVRTGTSERCFTLVGSGLSHKHQTKIDLTETYTLAYYKHS
jgi:hypothetical protein